MLMNRASYADYLEITRASVTNNVKKGKIVLTDNNMIDTDDPVNSEFEMYMKQRQLTGVNNHSKGRPKGAKNRKIQSEKIFIHENGSAAGLANMDRPTAERLKIIEGYEKARLANAKSRGDLIERALVERFVSKLYSVDRNEFLASCDKISLLVAGICGVNEDGKILELRKAILGELYKTQAHIKRVMDDFLLELKKNAVN